MITPSIIYSVITILLSLVDAIRIKIGWGRKPNINHMVSWQLSLWSGGGVAAWFYWHVPFTWWAFLAAMILVVGFVGIRLSLYDPLLNIFRIWTGTNPAGRIDYVSTVTNSYEDQHSEKVPFWCKCIGGALVWLLMFLLYKVIFKV